MGYTTNEESECASCACPTVLASATEQIQDFAADFQAGLMPEVVEAVLRSSAARFNLARHDKVYREYDADTMPSYAVRFRGPLAEAAEVTAAKLAEVMDVIDVADLERAKGDGVLDHGRTSGPPENCYPPEWVTEPMCPVCGEEAYGEELDPLA